METSNEMHLQQRFRSYNLQNEGGTRNLELHIDHELYATVAHNVAQFCQLASKIQEEGNVR